MKTTIYLYILAIILSVYTQDTPIVETQTGLVRGYTNGQVRYYYGIPYAKPPLGSLRFKPPQKPDNWTGIFEAHTPGFSCMQVKTFLGMNVNVSEDCLYLNIHTPSNASADSNLPVMFWIYGGSLKSGWGDLYNGSLLVNAGNVIVVTINYRLGAFGGLALQQLQQEDSSFATTGNYFLQDQRLALQWVNENIRAFGGNPDDVTIFGESAGAVSSCLHLTNTLSQPYFQAAIMHSGNCGSQTLAAGIEVGQQLLKTAGCDQASDPVACLRGLDAETLYEFAKTYGWAATIDGVDVLEDPYTVIRDNRLPNKPIMIGVNRNEASYFFCGSYADISAWEYGLLGLATFGWSGAVDVLPRYPVTQDVDAIQPLISLLDDYLCKCPSSLLASGVTNQSNSAYFYSFEQPINVSMWQGDCWGVPHTAELVFLWPNIPFYSLKPEDEPLSRAMLQYWTTFARFKNPNYSDAPVQWPQFGADSDYIILKHSLETSTQYRVDYCPGFWWNSDVSAAVSL
jgi:para-nitrobenzyl esterase